MTELFTCLNRIIESLISVFPRMFVVRSTHAGVKFRYGKDEVEIKPGICFYWPLVTEVEIFPVARQTQNLSSQNLTTKDGKKLAVSGVVVYAIRDIVAALAKNWDVQDTIADTTMCAIAHVIAKYDYVYLLEHLTVKIQAELTKETRRKLKPYGVRVYRTSLTDFSIALVIKNIGGSAGGTIIAHNRD